MRHCTTCGTQLHDNARFCQKCGVATPQFQQQTKTTSPLQNNDINSYSSKSNSSNYQTKHKKIFPIKLIAIIATICLVIMIGIKFIVPSYNIAFTEGKVSKLLKNDLNSSVEIIKLYYNEEKQGCFVEFQTNSYTDKAAIKLDTGEIVYESEFDYWSTKIGEHEYNQKILDSAFYAEWSFSVTIFEINGRPEDSDWKRIK